MNKLTNLRWLFSLLLIAFVWSGSAQAQEKIIKPDQQKLSMIESSAAIIDQGKLNPTRDFRSPVCLSGNLTEGFEGTVFPPAGWRLINGGGSQAWTRYTSTPITGSASASIRFDTPAHNDWLIAPRVVPQTGNATFAFKARNVGSAYTDRFNVKLSTTGNNEADFTVTLASNVGPGAVATLYSYDLTAYIGQPVYVAVQAISLDQNRLFIDDFTGPALYAAYFASDASLDFGVTFDQGIYSEDFEIANCSAGDLVLSFNSASPEVSIAGLPLTIATGDIGTITVSFDPSAVGLYNGNFKLNTNDPLNPTFQTSVLSAVQGAVITSSIFETFDDYVGFSVPNNWTGDFSTRTTGGLNNSARLTRNLWGTGTSMTGQFATNFVSMEDDGILSFYYRAVNYSSYPLTPTPATSFDFGIFISTDFGVTFTPIWEYDATAHTASLNYEYVEVDLSAYSGQTAMFVMAAVRLADDFWFDFDDFSVSFVEPGLQFMADELLMDDRPIGAWMKPASIGILNNPGRGNFTFTAVDLDNNYNGFLSAVSPTLPFLLAEGELTEEFGIRTNNTEATAGAYSGSLAFFYTPGTRDAVLFPYSGNAYIPVNGDVWEKAFNASSVTFPVTVAKGDFRDNYDLPGTAVDGWDVVYKIVAGTNDILANITLTGADAKMAIYPQGFGGIGGPDMDNALVSGTTAANNVQLYKGTYYLVVSTTGANYTLNYTPTAMPSPVAVTNLTPTDGAVNVVNGNKLTWSWGENTLEYRVVLGTTYPPATVVKDWATANIAANGSYTLAGLNPNMQYFWRIETRNNNGTTIGEVWGFTTTITPPSGLVATVNDPGATTATVSATLTWTGPGTRGFIGYNVYRGGIKITSTPITNATYTDIGLARNTSFSYYIKSAFDEGESAASNTATFTTKGVGNVKGVVYDVLNGPLQGATVRLQGTNGIYTFTTNAAGLYSGQVYAGIYSYTVSATDFDNQTLAGQSVTHNGTLTKDFYLSESPYPVADVVAFELGSDKVQVSWGGSTPPPPPPLVQEWLGYDNNGIPTQYWWAGAGVPFSWAINFEPADLADLAGTSLTKLAIFGTEASDVNTLNIYSGNLAAGTATLIHTQALTGLTLEAWNEVNLTVPVPLDITKQLWVSMHSTAPTDGVAASTPILNMKGDWVNFTGTWQHMSTGLGYDVTWSLRAFATNASNRSVTQLVHKYTEPRYNDVAISALTSTRIEGAKAFRPEYDSRAIVDYTVLREKVYQPGTLTELGTTGQLDFVDFDWGTMDWGVYHWAVVANYDGGHTSIPTFSNVLDKDMEVAVDVTVALNSNGAPGGTSVTFTNMSEPDLELVYNTALDNSGEYTWNAFRRGVYNIKVMLPGYGVVQENGVQIFDDASFEWLLEEILAQPANLYVTPTAFATWNLGGGGNGGNDPFVPFMESFDGLATGEIPAGWTRSPDIVRWGANIASTAGGTAPEMRFYWSPSVTGEYSLMTPSMSTAGQSQLTLSFDNYLWHYSVSYNYSVKVVAIADGVEHIIQEWNPVTANIPVGPLSYTLTAAHGVGASDFKIAWVFNGPTMGIYHWSFDNVMLNGSRAKAGRSFETNKVFLDGVLITETTDNNYQYDVDLLTPYETYTAGVSAVFSTGQSPRAEFDFIYVPCGDYATPTAFAAAQVEGTLNIKLDWTNVNAAALDTVSALRIYRDGTLYKTLDFTTAAVSTYTDADLDFGTYTYCLTYIYDSGAETCKGVVCSDEVEIDGNAGVDGKVTIAAYLGGGPLAGASVMLVNVANPATTFEFTTNSAGNYEGTVIAGTYNYTVSAAGYTPVELANVVIALNATVTNNFVLIEFPAPPIGVEAVEITDNNVLITWHSPAFAPFVPIFETFDNGIPSTWTVVDGGTSTDTWYMETPAGNPQLAGASLDGTNFAHVDSDEAGSGTSLNEMLYTPVVNASTVETLFLSFDQYYRHLGSSNGKVEVYDGTAWVTVLNQTATAGAWSNPNHQVIDVSAYANDQFQVRFVYTDGTSWSWYWSLDNVAITNEVTRSGAPVLANTPAPERGLFAYEVYRTTCATGNLQFLGLTLDSLFNDNTWSTVESGMYKWGVRAVYDQENYSEVIFSNCLDKDMTTEVSVKVTTNSGDLPDGTAVVFTNTSEPELELVYSVNLDETGYYDWAEFRKGTYDIHVEKLGFAAIEISGEIIDGPKNYVWQLEELLLPVSDLHVSPTGYATWRGGGVIPFEPFIEDFSAGIDEWTRIPATANWQLSQTKLAGGTIPEVRFYWSPNTTNRFYFISPMMSTLTQTELEMSFDHYIDDFGGGGYTIQLVTIADGVEHVVMDFPTADAPATNVITTLTEAHGVGAEDFQIAFVYDGEAWDMNWWNIDNIMVYTPGSRELEYYKVWLDGIFVADAPETFYQYDPATLTPGQEYFSEVAAMYSNGMSAKMNYTWTYYPCDSFPGPANLTYEVVNINNVVLNWSGNTPPPPPPGGEGIDEDFEGGSMPQGWTVNTTNSGTNGPIPSSWTINNYVSDDFSPFGTYHAGMWWDYGHQDEWLITPEFTCDAGAVMNFWTAVYEGSVNGDHYYVKVSTNGGSTWTSIWDASSLSGNAWNYYNSPYNIALTAYAGQEIKLAFQAVDGDGQGLWYVWFVDNVTVASPGRTIAFSPESLIRKSNSVGNNDQIARDGNIARIERASSPDYSMYAGEGEFVAEKATSATGIEIGFQDTQTREAVEIHYDNGYDNNAVGTGGAVTFMSAVRFTETELAQYYGNYELTDVKFIIHNPEFTNVTVKVWEGGSYGNPGTEVYSQDVTSQVTATTMTTATLTNAIALTAGKEYWIGYEVTVTTGHPAAVDAGPMVSGKGAWMYFGGAWDELTNISASLNYNWVIRGIINTTGGSNPGSSTFDPGEYLGANVYRDGELIAEMVQGETYSDLEVDPGYYDYCVTFVYEGNAMSCMTTCVTDVLVTEDCQIPQNLTATVGTANEVTLEWNGQSQQEFRYDDGTSTGQLGFSGGTTDGILGAKHTASAEITEMSWYTTAEGGPHTSVKIYILGLTSAGMPNANNVLYSATVSNSDDTWNTHTLPNPVTATDGFYIALGFNGFAGLGTDDGIGAPYVYQNNTHYYSSDYTGNSWTTFESSGFSVNAMIRAIGIVDAKASYAVAPESTPEMAADFDKTLNPVIYTINDPVATGTPDWSVPVRSMNREFLGFNIYRNGSLFVPLWPETTYVYQEGQGGETCYKVTAEYEFCGETDPSNQACVTLVDVKSNDLSQIRVYPNPSNSTVNIELTNNVSQVVIYNYLGQVVLENNITDQTTLQIDVRNYEAGAYLVKFVTSEGQSITKKVVVTK